VGIPERGTKVDPMACSTTGFGIAPFTPEELPMNGPAKNRLHEYEAGWLTLLLSIGVADEHELREAQNRVAVKAG
jgi:hypothetical protein